MIYADGKPTSGASATGIVGTVLGATALAGVLSQSSCGGNGNGLFGGLFGGGNCNNHCQDEVGRLRAELSTVTAERYADNVGIETFKSANMMSKEADARINANYKELAQAIALLDKNVAVENQKVNDNFAYLNSKIDTTKNEIICYVNGHFVPGKLIMPLDSICPRPLPGCTPITTNAQIIATAPAPTEGEISLNSVKK